MDFEQITGIFKATLGIDAWTPQESYKETFEKMANHARLVRRSTVQCKLLLTQIIAHKFDLYHRLTKAIYDHCAKYKVFFNYSEKEEISKAMNCGNADALYRILAANGINFSELKPFVETSIHTPEEILRLFEEEISTDPKREEIIESVYAAFLYHSFCEKDVHALNTGKPDGGTTFYQYLKNVGDFNDLMIQDYYKEQGFAFIMLIAGQIHQKMIAAVKSLGDHTISVHDILLMARCLKMERRGSRWNLRNARKRELQILKELGFVPSVVVSD